MAKLIEARTRVEAWMGGVEHLLNGEPTLNLVLVIESPGSNGRYPAADRYVDEFLADRRQIPIHTVAETIFPGYEYRKHGLRGVLDVYPDEVYPAIKKHPKISWGTYAYRLVRRRDEAGNFMNPLKQMIDKMKKELAKNRAKRSCYELGVAEGEYDLPLYNTTKDGTRRMGGPCLSHLSFKLFDGAVHLTALYRSHDYGYKVPGNLLGLARLQACVAHETGQRIGGLVVHSSYAFLSGGRGRIRALLEKIRTVGDQKEITNVLAR